MDSEDIFNKLFYDHFIYGQCGYISDGDGNITILTQQELFNARELMEQEQQIYSKEYVDALRKQLTDLQSKVLRYRVMIPFPERLKEYDEYFEIKIDRSGKI